MSVRINIVTVNIMIPIQKQCIHIVGICKYQIMCKYILFFIKLLKKKLNDKS